MKERSCIIRTATIALIFLICQTSLGQDLLDTYSIEKEIEIPIGREGGKVMVSYLHLGCSVFSPQSFAVDYAGNIIIGSRLQERKVQKFNNIGQFIKVIGYAGSGIENVVDPMRIRVDRENNIYIGDASHKNMAGNFLLKKFDSEGYFLGTIEKEGWKSRRRRGFDSGFKEKIIEDFWVSPMGNVYIKDHYSPRIFAFNSDCEYLGETDYFLVNSKEEVFKKTGRNKWSKFIFNEEQKTLPNSVGSMNREKEFSIEFDYDFSIEFLGFDKKDNLYFYRKSQDYAVYKYSPAGKLITEIDLPDEHWSRMYMDSYGNVYQLYLEYETYKQLTPGDHIEIVKWAPQIERKQEK